MQVGPQNPSVNRVNDLEHVVMVVPVNAEEDEAHDVGGYGRHYGPERAPLRPVRHLELQHHDRDENRDHAVAEGQQPFRAHDDYFIGGTVSVTSYFLSV